MKILLLLVLIIGCGKNMTPKEKNLMSTEFDSDLDGISNLDEVENGTDPFINESPVNNYLGETNTTLKVMLRTDKDHVESLSFFNLKESKSFFYKKEVLNKTLRPIYQKGLHLNYEKQTVNKDVLFKNILGCLSAEKMKSLRLKYPKYNLMRTDFFSDLGPYSKFKKTNFYIYDFVELEHFFFAKEGDGNESYKSYERKLKDSHFENGLCILYDNYSRGNLLQLKQLRKIVRLDSSKGEEKLQFSLIKNGIFSEDILKKRLSLIKHEKVNDIFFDMSQVDFNRYAQVQTQEYGDPNFNMELKEGDYVTVYDYISSNINNATIHISYAAGKGCDDNMERGRRCSSHPHACPVYHRPRRNSQNHFQSFDLLNKEDLWLKLNGKSFEPSYINDFLVMYKVKVSADMVKNGVLTVQVPSKSKTKVKFDSIYFSRSAPRSGGGTTYQCKRNISQHSSYSTFYDLKHNLTIKRVGAYR